MSEAAPTKRPQRKTQPPSAEPGAAAQVARLQYAALGALLGAAAWNKDEPGLTAVLDRVFTYADLGAPERPALTLSEMALVMAMLDAGLDELGSKRFDTPGAWLAGVLADKVGLRDFRLTERQLRDAAEQGAEVRVGTDLDQLLRDAMRFAVAVEARGSPALGLKHVLAIALMRGGIIEQLALTQRWETDAGLEKLRQLYLGSVIGGMEVEDSERWFKAYDALPRLPATDPPPGPPVVTTYSPDRPADDLDGPDPMRIDKDVTAFARLIAHQQMGTPLAIGVFGPWGSGKSSFMQRLEKAIDRLADPTRRHAGEDGFVSSVVHIRFNAWSFADANLWASLGAEFFDQLRVGGHANVGSDVHADLVEQVTAHVHDLRNTAEATRAVANEGERALADAQRSRDRAVRDARDTRTAAVTQGLLDGMARAHAAFKDDLGHTEDDLGRLVKVARDVQTAPGRGKTALKQLVGGGPRTVWPLAAFVAGLGGAVALYLFAPSVWLDWLGRSPEAWLTALVPGAAAYLAAFASGLRFAKRFAVETAAFAKQLKAADATVLADVLKAELALKEAASEAEARRSAAERATRALSRYIDPKGTSNPPRLLRYVLEDDPATRALEKEIGLISRTRRLFEAVDLILKEERRKRAADEVADRDVPERIVIYIDDLDRCTQDQVQSVLQAVHLLLAFESFVVVVGVDQVRVAEALARQFDTDDDPTNDSGEEIARRMDRAVLYLEKIFQLAFRLKPLSPAGSDGGAYTRFVEALTASAVAAAPAKAQEPAAGPPADAPVIPGPRLAPVGDQPGPLGPPVEQPTLAQTQAADTAEAKAALETLSLEPDEAKFLGSVAIGTVAGSTPRNVKRMVNVYRLARVRLAEDGFDVIGKAGPPLYPLLALFAAIDTGRKPQVAKRVFDALSADATPLDAIVRNALSAAETEVVAKAVADIFGRAPTAKDCRPVAELVRRYSFNALDF